MTIASYSADATVVLRRDLDAHHIYVTPVPHERHGIVLNGVKVDIDTLENPSAPYRLNFISNRGLLSVVG